MNPSQGQHYQQRPQQYQGQKTPEKMNGNGSHGSNWNQSKSFNSTHSPHQNKQFQTPNKSQFNQHQSQSQQRPNTAPQQHQSRPTTPTSNGGNFKPPPSNGGVQVVQSGRYVNFPSGNGTPSTNDHDGMDVDEILAGAPLLPRTIAFRKSSSSSTLQQNGHSTSNGFSVTLSKQNGVQSQNNNQHSNQSPKHPQQQNGFSNKPPQQPNGVSHSNGPKQNGFQHQNGSNNQSQQQNGKPKFIPPHLKQLSGNTPSKPPPAPLSSQTIKSTSNSTSPHHVNQRSPALKPSAHPLPTHQNGIPVVHDKDPNSFRWPKRYLYPSSTVQQLLSWRTYEKIGCGLQNMGNTCFLNAVLQALAYTPPLANFLLQGQHSKQCRVRQQNQTPSQREDQQFCLFCALELTVKQMHSHKAPSIQPRGIVSHLRSISRRFRLGRQEDSHEFLRFVMDMLQSNDLASYGGPKKIPDIRIQETTSLFGIFGGYFRSQVKCRRCNYKSNTYDCFLDLSLEVSEVNSVQKALHSFTRPEMLDQDNLYKCARCVKKVQAEKQLTIFKAPTVLCIHLKRFQFAQGGMMGFGMGGGMGGMFGNMFGGGMGGGGGGKINKAIQFSERLSLESFMSDRSSNPGYSLYAVLVHSGHSIHSGHYYCYVKSSSGQWHCMDDSSVRQVGLSHVLDQRAYILFYVRDQIETLPIAAPSPALGPQASPAVAMAVAAAANKKVEQLNAELAAKKQQQLGVNATVTAPQAKPKPPPQPVYSSGDEDESEEEATSARVQVKQRAIDSDDDDDDDDESYSEGDSDEMEEDEDETMESSESESEDADAASIASDSDSDGSDTSMFDALENDSDDDASPFMDATSYVPPRRLSAFKHRQLLQAFKMIPRAYAGPPKLFYSIASSEVINDIDQNRDFIEMDESDGEEANEEVTRPGQMSSRKRKRLLEEMAAEVADLSEDEDEEIESEDDEEEATEEEVKPKSTASKPRPDNNSQPKRSKLEPSTPSSIKSPSTDSKSPTATPEPAPFYFTAEAEAAAKQPKPVSTPPAPKSPKSISSSSPTASAPALTPSKLHSAPIPTAKTTLTASTPPTSAKSTQNGPIILSRESFDPRLLNRQFKETQFGQTVSDWDSTVQSQEQTAQKYLMKRKQDIANAKLIPKVQQKDAWDEELDRGHVRKIKTATPTSGPNSNGKNLFQSAQNVKNAKKAGDPTADEAAHGHHSDKKKRGPSRGAAARGHLTHRERKEQARKKGIKTVRDIDF